jgi:hypothetical protein
LIERIGSLRHASHGVGNGSAGHDRRHVTSTSGAGVESAAGGDAFRNQAECGELAPFVGDPAGRHHPSDDHVETDAAGRGGLGRSSRR